MKYTKTVNKTLQSLFLKEVKYGRQRNLGKSGQEKSIGGRNGKTKNHKKYVDFAFGCGHCSNYFHHY